VRIRAKSRKKVDLKIAYAEWIRVRYKKRFQRKSEGPGLRFLNAEILYWWTSS
jgi:hypothetical protein